MSEQPASKVKLVTRDELVRLTREIVVAINSRLVIDPRVPNDKITESTNLKSDLNFDGLSYTEVQISLEDALGITLDDDIWRACNTIGDIANLVAGVLKHI